MTFQGEVELVNVAIHALADEGRLTKRVLAVGIEINQRYTEYLDALLEADLSEPQGVTVDIDGEKVHFSNAADFDKWLEGILS